MEVKQSPLCSFPNKCATESLTLHCAHMHFSPPTNHISEISICKFHPRRIGFLHTATQCHLILCSAKATCRVFFIANHSLAESELSAFCLEEGAVNSKRKLWELLNGDKPPRAL